MMLKRTMLCAVLLGTVCTGRAGAENWPRFRGTDGTAQSADAKLPTKWDAGSVAWKTPLKGRGHSSPVVWGDRIFLTSALEDGKQRLVICVNGRDGKIAWEQVAWTGIPEQSHERNGWASATCCTDGERVYASFGKAGLHCYDMNGKHLWSRQLGEFQSATRRGTAASPVLVDNLVVLNGDSESDPFLFGINKLTGETVWKADRPAEEGYSTPVLVSAAGHAGGRELVLNGSSFIAGYDPASGKELWRCKSFAGRGEPLPAIGDGVVYVVNGQPGDVYAVRTGGGGDVTKTEMAWHTPRRGGRDGPSPIVADGVLLVSNMVGIASGYDAATGKELWKQRIGGPISASPFAANGHVYLLYEDGETLVMDPGRSFKEVSRNSVGPGAGEIFRASPAPYAGHILLRSDRTLYCVGSPLAASPAADATR